MFIWNEQFVGERFRLYSASERRVLPAPAAQTFKAYIWQLQYPEIQCGSTRPSYGARVGGVRVAGSPLNLPGWEALVIMKTGPLR